MVTIERLQSVRKGPQTEAQFVLAKGVVIGSPVAEDGGIKIVSFPEEHGIEFPAERREADLSDSSLSGALGKVDLIKDGQHG
jgi:hypothetical protein